MANGSPYGKILLVGEHQEESVSQLVFIQHSLQLLTSFNYTVAIVAVDDEDDALSVLEVMPPQRSNLVLSADIPDGELDILVFDSFNIKA